MPFKFNPFTGTLDISGTGIGGTTFDPDTILTFLFDVLMDQFGNVLVSG